MKKLHFQDNYKLQTARRLRREYTLSRRGNVYRHGGKKYQKQKYDISGPELFNLAENYEEAATFLQRIRRESILRHTPFSVDFTTIKEISPAAALVLTAEMDRWRRLKGAKLRPCELHKWNPTVKRLLNEMGFFEVLGIVNPCAPEDRLNQETTFLKFSSHVVSDGTYAKDLRVSLEEITGTIDSRIFMYNGLIEAMANSVEHAYPPQMSHPPEINQRWWMSASYTKESGRMTVMVYDQGVGIPTTLPNSRFWDVVWNILSVFGLASTDGNLIKAAMKIGETVTELENRGLGLHEMKEFVRRSGNGLLRIISGKGDYIYTSADREKVKDNDTELGGTLVAWEIFTKDSGE